MWSLVVVFCCCLLSVSWIEGFSFANCLVFFLVFNVVILRVGLIRRNVFLFHCIEIRDSETTKPQVKSFLTQYKRQTQQCRFCFKIVQPPKCSEFKNYRVLPRNQEVTRLWTSFAKTFFLFAACVHFLKRNAVARLCVV